MMRWNLQAPHHLTSSWANILGNSGSTILMCMFSTWVYFSKRHNYIMVTFPPFCNCMYLWVFFLSGQCNQRVTGTYLSQILHENVCNAIRPISKSWKYVHAKNSLCPPHELCRLWHYHHHLCHLCIPISVKMKILCWDLAVKSLHRNLDYVAACYRTWQIHVVWQWRYQRHIISWDNTYIQNAQPASIHDANDFSLSHWCHYATLNSTDRARYAEWYFWEMDLASDTEDHTNYSLALGNCISIFSSIFSKYSGKY